MKKLPRNFEELFKYDFLELLLNKWDVVPVFSWEVSKTAEQIAQDDEDDFSLLKRIKIKSYPSAIYADSKIYELNCLIVVELDDDSEEEWRYVEKPRPPLGCSHSSLPGCYLLSCVRFSGFASVMWGQFQLIIPSDNKAMACFTMGIEPPPSICTLFIPLVREDRLVWLKE